MEKAKKQQETKGTPLSDFVEYLEMFVFAVIFVVVLMTFFVRLCEVDGPSMNKTLTHGEKLLISDMFYTPQTGDVIVFHQNSSDMAYYNKPIVKRVIATGGQYVKINYQTNGVYVSDDAVFEETELLDESSYAFYDSGLFKEAALGETEEVFAVPQGYLFVLGDNRNNSADSRNAHIGMVNESHVLGRVLLRLAPFTMFKRGT